LLESDNSINIEFENAMVIDHRQDVGDLYGRIGM
jgi:hypothetical protein